MRNGTNGASVHEQLTFRLCFMSKFKEMLQEILPYAGVSAGMVALVFAIVSPILWLQASQEAAAFNRFTTGPRATTWDALWVELRVEADR